MGFWPRKRDFGNTKQETKEEREGERDFRLCDLDLQSIWLLLEQ